MEYLTLLNYLYVITFNARQKAKQETAFFLTHHLTVLNNLYKLKHQSSAHQHH